MCYKTVSSYISLYGDVIFLSHPHALSPDFHNLLNISSPITLLLLPSSPFLLFFILHSSILTSLSPLVHVLPSSRLKASHLQPHREGDTDVPTTFLPTLPRSRYIYTPYTSQSPPGYNKHGNTSVCCIGMWVRLSAIASSSSSCRVRVLPCTRG